MYLWSQTKEKRASFIEGGGSQEKGEKWSLKVVKALNNSLTMDPTVVRYDTGRGEIERGNEMVTNKRG